MYWIAIVLYAVGFGSAILLALAIPFSLGLMAYDIHESRKNAAVGETEARRRVTVERGTARAFVIAGGVFWSIASVGGLYSLAITGTRDALVAAVLPLLASLATLVVGWYYERTTSVLLLLGSVGVVAWGVIYQLDPGAWALVAVALLGPMMTASSLFWMARVDQDAFEKATSVRLQLTPVFAARSTLSRARAAA